MAMAECQICDPKDEAPRDVTNSFKAYDCPKHGKFRISLTVLALSEYRNSDARRWEAALKRAKADAKRGELPTINYYHFPSAP
jgi:hypothetical protein